MQTSVDAADRGAGPDMSGWGDEDAAENDGADAAQRNYLTFTIGGETFAVEVRHVREVLDLQPVTQLPNAPGEVVGMIDVRGESVAVVDLGARLGMMRERDEIGRIVVFEMGAEARPIGAVADRVLDVVEIPEAAVEPTPQTATGWRPEAVVGVARVGGAMAMLLDVDGLFGLRRSGRGADIDLLS